VIEFKNVTKTLAAQPVISEVSLKLAPQQVHALIGESGSGKSTLVRLASGLLAPTIGNVLLNGVEASSIPDTNKAKVFGYLVQDGGLFPHLTGFENVALPGKVHNLEGSIFIERYKMLCALVGLAEKDLQRFPRELSGGQRQRVALLRALILDPPLLFLDEPLGALDPIVRSDLQVELKKIFQDLKKTVVLVTHDLAEAAFLCENMVLLHNGKVEQQGSLQDFFNSPQTEYVKKFLAAQRPPPKLGAWKGFYD
jgi:osmoprotectant transport system ATP-binding protein